MRIALTLLPLALVSACKSGDAVQPIADVASAEAVASLEPAAALEALKTGNLRHVAGAPLARDWKAQAEASAEGAHPYAVVLTSTDSRVPVQRAFDAGVGDLVAVRVPGPALTADTVAALEAGARAGCKVLVVMTHSDCDEIQAACGAPRPGAARGFSEVIDAAIQATPTDQRERVALGPEFQGLSYADAVAVQHARLLGEDVLGASDEIAALERGGALAVVAAYYDIATGAVVWLP